MGPEGSIGEAFVRMDSGCLFIKCSDEIVGSVD